MGSSKWHDNNGALGAEYREIGRTANGIKIVQSIKNTSANTPSFSNTPHTMYASLKGNTGKVNQITPYGRGDDGRGKIKDIDLGHEHTNRINGLHFGGNDIHVHEYNAKGVRSNEARRPSKKEKRLIMQAVYERS